MREARAESRPFPVLFVYVTRKFTGGWLYPASCFSRVVYRSRASLAGNTRSLRVRYLHLSCFALSLLLLATPAAAQQSYTAPAEFMNLFFDFTGSNEPGYPAGQPTLGQMLTQAGIAKEGGARGPLVLVVGSDIYVYESSGGARLAHARFRADRASGLLRADRNQPYRAGARLSRQGQGERRLSLAGAARLI